MSTTGRDIDPTHWSYSGDPASSPKDFVRSLVGDVNKENRLVSDHEIRAFLADEGGNVRLAAAACCDLLAGYFANEVDSSTEGGESKSLSQRSEAYAKRAERLREEAASRMSLVGMPYCGAISRADKAAEEADPDRVAPLFTRDMHDNPGDDDAADWG